MYSHKKEVKVGPERESTRKYRPFYFLSPTVFPSHSLTSYYTGLLYRVAIYLCSMSKICVTTLIIPIDPVYALIIRYMHTFDFSCQCCSSAKHREKIYTTTPTSPVGSRCAHAYHQHDHFLCRCWCLLYVLFFFLFPAPSYFLVGRFIPLCIFSSLYNQYSHTFL